jgi:hypothetical protein
MGHSPAMLLDYLQRLHVYLLVTGCGRLADESDVISITHSDIDGLYKDILKNNLRFRLFFCLGIHWQKYGFVQTAIDDEAFKM